MINKRYRRWNDRTPLRFVVYAIVLLVPAAYFAGRVSGPYVLADEKPVPRALPGDVERFYDASEDVTCWRMRKRSVLGDSWTGLSCLPQQWLASAREIEQP